MTRHRPAGAGAGARILLVATLAVLLNAPADAQTRSSRATPAGTVTPTAGTRQVGSAAASVPAPLDRIDNRLSTRIDARLQTRLDRNYLPSQTGSRVIEAASRNARRTRQSSRSSQSR